MSAALPVPSPVQAVSFTIEVRQQIRASPLTVWRFVGDWDLNYLKSLCSKSEVTSFSKADKRCRSVCTPDGKFEEELALLDGGRLCAEYNVLKAPATLPCTAYAVRVQLESAPNGCNLLWHSAGTATSRERADEAKRALESGVSWALGLVTRLAEELANGNDGDEFEPQDPLAVNANSDDVKEQQTVTLVDVNHTAQLNVSVDLPTAVSTLRTARDE